MSPVSPTAKLRLRSVARSVATAVPSDARFWIMTTVISEHRRGKLNAVKRRQQLPAYDNRLTLLPLDLLSRADLETL